MKQFRLIRLLGVLTLTAALLLSGCAKGEANVSPTDAENTALLEHEYDLTNQHLKIQQNVVYDGSYRSQLTPDEQIIYDAMAEHFSVERSQPKDFSVDISAAQNQYGKHNILDWAATVANAAFVADHPECFWTSFTGTEYQSHTLTASSVTLRVRESYSKSFDDVETVFAGIEAAVGEIGNGRASDSRYDTVKAIHDYICQKAEYSAVMEQTTPDAGSEEESSWDTDFLTSHLAPPIFGGTGSNQLVCEGYALAFKLLCSRFDIPCYVISGETPEGAHSWNAVQMDDGQWYGVDVTWDDQGDTPGDVYFLCGQNTPIHPEGKGLVEKGHENDTFADVHTPFNGLTWMPVEDQSVTQLPAVLTFPSLAQEAYRNV